MSLPSDNSLSLDYRLLFESAPGLYLALTPTYEIVAASDTYLAATMTRRGDVVGRRLFDVFPDSPEDASATGVRNLTESLERVLANRAADVMAVQRYSIRRPDSQGGGFEERFWSPVNLPVFGPDGEVAFILHRVEDVTEFVRRKSQDAERDKLADALRDRADRMEADVVRRGQELQEANRQLRDAKAELERRVDERTAELSQTTAQLIQAQKMEAIGQLAGGVAHDFNNLLTIIAGYSELLETTGASGGEVKGMLKEIRAASDRASALTRQLLAFSRQQVLEPRVLDLNAVIVNTEKMLRRLIGEDVDLALALAPDLHRVKADPGQIDQVVMNIAVNARDAMPQGGKLTIETRNVELDSNYVRTHPETRAGEYVRLAISDTGCGMTPEVRARVFEPFFTTKGVGKGTGLGLSVVHGIVKQSGGSLEVYSELGVGTSFKIHLPAVRDSAVASWAAAHQSKASPGSETILLVEDESAVRELAALALRQCGYQVLTADDGVTALDVWRDKKESIDLVVTDVVMREMSGRKLAEHVLADDPAMKILYLSGYTDDAVVRHGILHADFAFLQKPFTPTSLAKKVRDVLDRK